MKLIIWICDILEPAVKDNQFIIIPKQWFRHLEFSTAH